MGYPRRRPRRLAEKLLQIRRSLGVSQRELIKELGLDIPCSNISKYELDKNEAPINVLLAYARLAKVPLENLVDDQLELR